MTIPLEDIGSFRQSTIISNGQIGFVSLEANNTQVSTFLKFEFLDPTPRYGYSYHAVKRFRFDWLRGVGMNLLPEKFVIGNLSSFFDDTR